MAYELTDFDKIELEDSFITYQIWEGIRSHFAYDKYNWEDYGPKSNLKFENYMNHKHRMHFLKLHRRFKGKRGELTAHIAANFMVNPKFFIMSALSKEAFKNALEYNAIFEDFELNFRQWVMVNIPVIMQEHNVTSFMELIRVKEYDEPWLLSAISNNDVPEWFAVGLDLMINYRVRYNEAYSEHFVWQGNSKRISKLLPWFPFNDAEINSLRVWLTKFLKEKGLN